MCHVLFAVREFLPEWTPSHHDCLPIRRIRLYELKCLRDHNVQNILESTIPTELDSVDLQGSHFYRMTIGKCAAQGIFDLILIVQLGVDWTLILRRTIGFTAFVFVEDRLLILICSSACNGTLAVS